MSSNNVRFWSGINLTKKKEKKVRVGSCCMTIPFGDSFELQPHNGVNPCPLCESAQVGPPSPTQYAWAGRKQGAMHAYFTIRCTCFNSPNKLALRYCCLVQSVSTSALFIYRISLPQHTPPLTGGPLDWLFEPVIYPLSLLLSLPDLLQSESQ